MEIAIVTIISLVLGGGGGWLLSVVYIRRMKALAQREAQEILQEAQDALELIELDQKEQLQEIELELWTKEEAVLLKVEERIEELEELSVEKKQKADDRYSQERQKSAQHEQQVKKEEERMTKLGESLKKVSTEKETVNQSLVQSLCERLKTSREEVSGEIIATLESDAREHAENWIEHSEEETKTHVESKAKQILDRALVRFHRAYSAERGIAAVYFENPAQRQLIVDANGLNMKALQEVTGCDIFIENEMEFVGVAGFDPVRRELARRILERCLKEKKTVTPDFIKRTSENIKRELLSLIKKDGDQLTKELRLDGVHPEIRQIMGSLRYRYSFTQNQYFHCGEVGWLCGLLASELGTVEVKKGRRAGMLHDLGKAMDHELDGGHAVIGANFIQARGEAPDIVHAVKAHHYDEQPTTDLAYLVIAADAISGARPGARRSTMESYTQKVTELESISKSFHGVVDCYVLNGGRECRVIVNGRQVDDTKALDLSKAIAHRIEEECNYPGHIKVVVVRETTSHETTRPAHA